ncbi:MAG: phosphodiesterase [Candidatus Enteromonas sp.]|nr:phosphodiesterase [Candidatus Enteromonas sp.]
MRALIISDTHGRIEVLKKLDTLFATFQPDQILFLGDALNNGPRNGVPLDYDPMGCAALFNKWSRRIIAVRGNCDSRVDQTLLHFDISSDSKVHYLNGFRCDLIHGDLLTSDLLEVQRGDILFFGHTHVYMLKKADGVVYFNPGSPSFPKNGNPPTYGVMDGLRLEIRKLDDDLPLATLDLY